MARRQLIENGSRDIAGSFARAAGHLAVIMQGHQHKRLALDVDKIVAHEEFR